MEDERETSETYYLGHTPIEPSTAWIRRWGFPVAFAEALVRCMREIDRGPCYWEAVDRWADDGGHAPDAAPDTPGRVWGHTGPRLA